jgi:hypothetical protein
MRYKFQEQCPDCGVHVGEIHDWNCDVGRCMICGGQRLSCDCPETDESLDTWTGYWPGTLECQEYGFWCYWNNGWYICDKDHPEAREDLNTLYEKTSWNPKLKRRVLDKE